MRNKELLSENPGHFICPIAQRLGLYQIKNELEDLVIGVFINPPVYEPN